jgi:transposase
MQVVYERCCGLDVHKKTVVACVLTPADKQVQSFGTTTAEIRRLQQWLLEQGCTMVAMESTGVYWKPIYNLLEDTSLELMVVNARAMKAVPGRKTDVKDAEWIADLLRHGLLKPSFIPDRAHRELAELVRYRRSLIGEQARELNRIQKVLEGANIKLASVVSSVRGVSARAMIEALIRGIEDPEAVAQEVTTSLKATHEELVAALEGEMHEHQRQLLAIQLRHLDFLRQEIAGLDAQIEERLRPFATEVALLDTIPGVGIRTAQEIIAAIGTDMSRFQTHRHLASWAKLCPGTRESAGNRKPERIGKGNRHLRTALVEAAKAAARSKKHTYLSAQYHRLAARRGGNRATIAVAHSILVSVYYILRDHKPYADLGPTYFDDRDKEATIRRLVSRLEQLGQQVTCEPAA